MSKRRQQTGASEESSSRARSEPSNDLADWAGPVSDAPLIAILHDQEYLKSTRITWRGFRDARTVIDSSTAARDLDCKSLRVARARLVRWKLWPGERHWNYFTLFVPDDAPTDLLSLKVLLGVSDVSLVEDAEEIDDETIRTHLVPTLAPPTVPPVFPPFVVHRDLLWHNADEPPGFYLWGTTNDGLWEVNCPSDSSEDEGSRSHCDVSAAFQELLGEYDTYFLEPSILGPHPTPPSSNDAAWQSCSRQDLPPIAEQVLSWLIQVGSESPDKLDFMLSDRQIKDTSDDESYWSWSKAERDEQCGDNAYFAEIARLLSPLMQDARLAGHRGRGSLHRLAAVNPMLAAGFGQSTWMLFPQTLTVYSRTFFPFAMGTSETGSLREGDIRLQPFLPGGSRGGHWNVIDRYLATRRFLAYCRLTQFAQVDITDLADPRPYSPSQTATVLRGGKHYAAFKDIRDLRGTDEGSLGNEVDDELGIRSHCYVRLLPTGIDELAAEVPTPQQAFARLSTAYQPLLYIFAHSLFREWFQPILEHVEELKTLQQQVPIVAATSLWILSHNEWERRTTLAHMVHELRQKASASADDAVSEFTDALGVAVDKAHTILFLEILSSYSPRLTSLKKLISDFTERSLQCALTFAVDHLPETSRSRFLSNLSAAPINDQRFLVDADKLEKVLLAIDSNAAERASGTGRKGGSPPHARLVVETRERERLVGISLRNDLPSNRLPTVHQYRRSRQLVPDHYLIERGNGVLEPRGIGVFLARVALREITMRVADRIRTPNRRESPIVPEPNPVWLRVSLIRLQIGTRPARPVVRRESEGALSPRSLLEYRPTWEATLCLGW